LLRSRQQGPISLSIACANCRSRIGSSFIHGSAEKPLVFWRWLGMVAGKDGMNVFVQRIVTARWAAVMSGVIITTGLLLRLCHYLFNRSLWYDELMLIRNILERSPALLLAPLDYHQGAPILYLLAVKTVTIIFGPSEYVLRLIPFIAGTVGLLYFYKLSRLILAPAYVPLALLLFAFSYRLVYYSQEAKQYSSDVAVTVLLIYIGLRASEGGVGSKRLVALAVAGCAAIFFSHPAIFVLAAIAGVFGLCAFEHRGALTWRAIGVLAAGWLVCEAVSYWFFGRTLLRDDGLVNYWTEGFLPVPITLTAMAGWLKATLSYTDYLGFRYGLQYAALIFSMLIAVTEIRKRSLPWMLIVSIAIVACGASMFRLYPFAGRVALYLAPCLILTTVKGVEFIGEKFGRAWSALVILGIGLSSIASVGPLLLQPIVKEEARPVIHYMRQNIRKGDYLYVYYNARHAAYYYHLNESETGANLYCGIKSREDKSRYLADLEHLGAHPRVWFFFTHTFKDEESFFTSHIAGTLLDQYREPGASAYLYDCSSDRKGRSERVRP
jgi:hypothetical protein